MINISLLSSGALLIQRDAAEILIDRSAIAQALGPIVRELIDSGTAIGLARKDGYESGLLDGRERARIEYETLERCRERSRADAAEDAPAAALCFTLAA